MIGCCNKVSSKHLVRPAVKIPFMAVCEVHRKRLHLHQICPGCGQFCSQVFPLPVLCFGQQVHVSMVVEDVILEDFVVYEAKSRYFGILHLHCSAETRTIDSR